MPLDPQNSGEGSDSEDDSDPNNSDPLPQPEGIVVDKGGNVFVNETGENRIHDNSATLTEMK
jgi:secreted PhoX family phosphatase